MWYNSSINGVPYKRGDWKKFVIHDENNIRGFFSKYRFLSNFFDAEVWFEGLKYRSSEVAYQSAKVIPAIREPFTTMDDGASKKAWKVVPKECVLPDWDKRKYDVMSSVVFEKFLRNKGLQQKLLETENRYLEELNIWKDTYWGVDTELGGQNHLGKILMKVREYWK